MLKKSHIEESHAEVSVNWKIYKFFPMQKDLDYFIESPLFLFLNSKWYLRIYPNGTIRDDNIGFVSLFLIKLRSRIHEKKQVSCTMGIRKSNGSIYKSVSFEFQPQEKVERGSYDLLETSNLQCLNENFPPDNSLTLFCSAHIKTAETMDSSTGEIDPQIPFWKSEYFPVVDTLKFNLEDLFQHGCHSDAVVKVKNEKFPVHRSILAIRSPVFCSMFQHDMKEKSDGVIDIEDFNPEDVKNFLLFVYAGKTNHVTSTNAANLYRISHKYDVKDSKSICCQVMIHGLSIQTFCEIVQLAYMYDESELLKVATIFFIKNVKKIVRNPKWISFLAENHSLVNELLIKMTDAMQ